MLEEASTLLAQRESTDTKQKILDAFTTHFLLSSSDLDILTNSDPINPSFFEVLNRCKQIHHDCELLLAYENQRLGLELMEQTARNLNSGYKKLYTWTSREFKSLDLEDPQISGGIRRSLRALSERPSLFTSCLDSFAAARQVTVAEHFQAALTDSVSGRAIDFSTHDPLRYMGDMLAWVHSATVSEMEALEGLFISDADEISKSLTSGRAADPVQFSSESAPPDAFNGHEALVSLISRNMVTVASTLNSRITITVRNLTDTVEVYQAYNLLTFYHDMIQKLTRSTDGDNSILSTLADLEAQTFKRFETIALDGIHVDDPLDLQPPSALTEMLAQFSKIVNTRGPIEDEEFAKLYSTLVKPVVEACSSLAREMPDDGSYSSTSAGLIFKSNYMTLVRDVLTALVTSKIDVAKGPLQQVSSEIDLSRASLIDVLRDQFLMTSGIEDISEILSGSSRSAIQQKIKLLGERDGGMMLERFAGRLDGFLASSLMDTQDDLGRLIDRDSAAVVVKSAVEMFCEEFEEIVEALEGIDEGVEREVLAKKMGKRSNAENSEDEVEKRDDEGDDAGGAKEPDDEGEGELHADVEDLPALREIYPRTLEEVKALLS